MIPKIIHYCWFGGKELPPLGKRCIDSWKKNCPDYEIIEWNEKNYDCSVIPYIKEAYEAEKWAFVSDYARLDIIYRYGGIYLDVDVEILKNLDFLLETECFLATETTNMIATGLGFGAETGNSNIKMMMDQYQDVHFKIGNDLYDMIPCPHRNTFPFQQMGYKANNQIQYMNGAVIYPTEYFCPMDYKTKQLKITENTIAIHHYNASWLTPEEIAFEAKVQEYKKSHGRIESIFYRKWCEYYMYYDNLRIKNIVVFLSRKIKKKYNRLSQKRNGRC